MKTFEKKFRADHPETVGETDKEFNNHNYTEWLEQKLSQFMSPDYLFGDSTAKRQALSAKLNEINDPELTQLVHDAQLELMRESEKAMADPA